MAKVLFTIGYEGFEIGEFVAHLKNNDIDCLLDVREIPLSRKRGFSKRALAQRLKQADIHYVHLRDLGSPKSIREDLKLTENYSNFFDKIEKHLVEKKESIETAYKYVVNYTCCLMCFERLAARCHRKMVAAKIQERDGNGLKIKNV